MSSCTLRLTTFEALTVTVAVGYNVDTTHFQHHRRFHWTVWIQMLENNKKTRQDTLAFTVNVHGSSKQYRDKRCLPVRLPPGLPTSCCPNKSPW